jgi:predicted PurR-regulated permease PerM
VDPIPILHTSSDGPFLRRSLLLLTLLAGFALIWYAADVFILAFLGILLAILLDALTQWTAARTKLARGWCFLLVVLAVAALVAIGIWQLGPRVILQANQLVGSLPRLLGNVRQYLGKYEWGKVILRQMPAELGTNVIGKATALSSKTFEAISGVVVALIVGLYVGADPQFYIRGLLRLFPPDKANMAERVLAEVGYTLRWWILGQLVPMIVLGAATMAGLWLLGVPLAFTLGLFTALMVFIPYLGSLIALLATVLVALTQSATLVLYSAVFFLGIHAAEAYLLTPIVQKRAVFLPPALTILVQLLMGILLGFLGLMVATPLTAAALVLVKMLYLHEKPEHHAESPPSAQRGAA